MMNSTAIRSTAIRRLADVRMADVAEVGGKAASLGELLAAGVRVPDGVVLTAAAADMTPDERRTLVRAGAADLGIGPFAVRSSGIAEDGAEHSYAGIYESVLDVRATSSPPRRSDAWPAPALPVRPSTSPTPMGALR
jgi:phosphoenolpyruvate synthase/pyruvate phosphate dikinase